MFDIPYRISVDIHAPRAFSSVTMSTPSPSQPSETTPPKKKLRSPSYPYLDLSEATRLAKILWEKEKRHPAPVSVVAVHWNYGAKSSTGLLAVAALKKFGLLDEEGSGDQRTVKLSDFALDIIKHEDSPDEISKLLKAAALKPEIHRDLWENHREASDANIKRVLIFDKKFNDASVDSVIKEYRDTIAFAKLTSADTLANTDDQNQEENQQPVEPVTTTRTEPPITNLSTANVITRPHAANVTRGFTFPLDDENEVELKFLGTAFGLEQLDALSDVIDFLKTRFKRKRTIQQPKTMEHLDKFPDAP